MAKNTIMDFVAIDFETATGNRHSMCAVGLVVVKDNQIVERFKKLIQPPGNVYHFMNTRVNQITPEMTKDAPRFPEIYPTLKEYLHKKTVVCHNAKFDLDVLAQTMDHYNLQDRNLSFSYECTYEIFGEGLKKCCEKYHIPLNHHDPLSDAEATAKLFILHSSGDECHFDESVDSSNGLINETSVNQRICGSVLKPDLNNVENKDNPFFGKKVVISGTYNIWPDRKDLAVLLKNLGADIDSGVTERTNILIAGEGVGPSKLNKMIANINEGRNAIILQEKDVIEKLKGILY